MLACVKVPKMVITSWVITWLSPPPFLWTEWLEDCRGKPESARDVEGVLGTKFRTYIIDGCDW